MPEDELSAHIASRLEVERILLGVGDGAVALRAGVVLGAGSTSFEIIRQIATLFLVQPVPLVDAAARYSRWRSPTCSARSPRRSRTTR